MIDFLRMLRRITALKRYLPYAADVGMAAYLAISGVIMAVIALETVTPGFAVNFLAPQTLVTLALGAAALSLVTPTPGPRGLRQRVTFWLTGALAGGFAFWAAWRYFTSVPDARLPLAAAIAGAVLLAFGASSADDEL
jgi:hypothetical protein